MNPRWQAGLLFASAVVNIVLVIALWLTWQSDSPLAVTLVRPPTVTNVFRPVRTNLVVQARSVRWSDIESTNYFAYISNLRAFGCPEPTIRDLITAEIDQLFADRAAREIVSPLHQWWRARPDADLVRLADQQRQALELERRNLLEALLGPGSEAAIAESHRAANPTPLDGPVLGALDAGERLQVREIEARRREQLQALGGGDPDAPPAPPDPAEVARIEARTRTELARVLSPEQLEEYLLRYSRTAAQLRQQTREFAPSQEEFRSLFRAVDPLNQALAALGDDPSEEADKQRVQMLALRQAAIEDTLDPQRHAEYQLSQDPAFIAMRETAARFELPETKVVPLYEIDQVTREERARILNDSSLTPEEQSTQLGAVEQQRLDSIRQLVGEAAFRRLQTGVPP